MVLVCLARVSQLDFFERLERMTFDMRVREAAKFPSPIATNLGFVFISDDSITAVNETFRVGLYWPRQIYGRAYRELSSQGAKAVAFDVLFPGPRLDHGQVPVSNLHWPEVNQFYERLHAGQSPPVSNDETSGEKFTHLESDEYFAWQLHRGGTAVLAAEQNVMPNPLFATNAFAVADIGAYRDSDGVLRRARVFSEYRRWHPAFQQAEAEGYVDLRRVRIETNQIVLLRPDGTNLFVKIDAATNFDLADFGGRGRAPAFTVKRVWHMGIVLAARELGLDLANASIDLPHGEIILRGTNGVERTIPVDADGYFYINWELTSTDSRLTKEPFEHLLAADGLRQSGRTNEFSNRWAGRLAVIGSNATGNDLTDRGATPLEKDTFLVTKHWNVANSLITGRFVRRAAMTTELGLIVVLGLLAAIMTWELRVLPATFSVLGLGGGYCLAATFLYVQQRYWLPLVLPGVTVVLVQYVGLVAYRVIVEQAEKRRVKNVFSKIVSPDIVNELLGAEKLSLGGARREVTVLFADVRGFTKFTDESQQHAEAHVLANKLSGPAVEAYYDEQAREALQTVNTYLSLVADNVKECAGTLDKYIGDCVMAFWGAPTPNPRHAAECVRAAIAAQRAIYDLNRQRAEFNRKLEAENAARTSAGLPNKLPLPILLLGSGINTGLATVGLMGSESHISNYTVFGREVNLASRLEGHSGRGRIVISERTREHLLRDEPALAATCVPLSDAELKGFRSAVKVYEVPWRPAGSISLDEEFFGKKVASQPETDMVLRSLT